MNYLSMFEVACDQLPAVLRKNPYFDTPNKLCVGSTYLANEVNKLITIANTTATNTLITLDTVLSDYSNNEIIPDGEICKELAINITLSEILPDTDNLERSVYSFLDSIDEAVRYLDLLKISFNTTGSFNHFFLDLDIFSITLAIFMISTFLDISILLLPKPSNSKIHLGRRKVVVNIVEAAFLVAKDMNGKSDPYVVISLHPPPRIICEITGKKIFGPPIKQGKSYFSFLLLLLQ